MSGYLACGYIVEIKYVFNNSRDKGQELYDWYGEYKLYDLVQEGCCENPEYVEYELPEEVAPDPVYELGFNQRNRAARKQAVEDTEHNVLPTIEAEQFCSEQFGITGGEWVTKDYDEQPDEEGRARSMVGTALAEVKPQ